MRQLTPEEVRRRNRKVMNGYLLPYRLFLACGTFVMDLRAKGPCGALKEARKMWRLEIG